jgi:Predicted nucleotide-binding protein containing TIR-like domain/YheO-like PAS domain
MNKNEKPIILILCTAESLSHAYEIQTQLEYECICIIWNQGVFTPGSTTINALIDKMEKVDFTICIWSGDDTIVARGDEYAAPRDNLLLETGMSISKVGLDRTFVVFDKSKNVKIPTDLQGVTLIGYNAQKGMDITHILATSCNVIRRRVEELGKFCNETSCLKDEILILKSQLEKATKSIKGKRLFQYKGYYPIKLDENNFPSIDETIYKAAMTFFLEDKNHDELAVMDLLYLRENNLAIDGDFLTDEDHLLYEQLIIKYEISPQKFKEENDNLLKSHIRIVNDIGETFKNTYSEFLLHNVRNPIHSIIVAKNTEKISGRKIGDPSTRFVYQYVKNQGKSLMEAMEDGSKICYYKKFGKDKYVKATTTPIFDDKYGLIAILCVNVDIDAITHLDSIQKAEFFDAYIKNSGHTPPFEK